MTRPRSQIVSLDATPYYHCISRCVRRAFLCGNDRFSGKCFDHRKPWLIERLAFLEEIFAIDIAAYAVMSNHYHLVLHVNSEQAQAWSDEEVVARWTRLYKGPMLIQRYQAKAQLSEEELKQAAAIIKRLRATLHSISRFMACLNEYIARKANQEDACTGRFWEGRFKSQALLDETALLSCMVYVDLNPVRAGIATNLHNSDYTSIKDRIEFVKHLSKKQKKNPQKTPLYQPPRLMPFAESLSKNQQSCAISYNLKDYLELADWTGRVVRHDKRGSIEQSAPKLLSTLHLNAQQWQLLALSIQKESITMLNGLQVLQQREKKENQRKAA